MLVIPHYVGKSEIEGVGVFAGRDIAAGECIYRFDPRFVAVFTDAELQALPAAVQQTLRKYTYRGRGVHRLSGAVYYCTDDSRFFNHADVPNTRWVEEDETYVAVRAIPAHCELTCDYREFTDPEDHVVETFDRG